MKRFGQGWLLLPAIFIFVPRASAQSSLEMLQKELDDIKQAHQETASKNLEYFFTSLQAAEDSAPAAEKLYLDAGGAPPDRARVITQYEHETPNEESARKAIDQAAMASLDASLQVHCGLMRFAALFVTQPKQADLSDQWTAWLKNAAQIYPQLAVSVQDPRHGSGRLGDDGHHSGGHTPPPVDAGAPIRRMQMSQSIISDYLGFHDWGDKDQGKWSVSDLPALYHDQILEPLRKTPSADTMAAWDTYIAMKNADQSDGQTWNDVDYPDLQFERACDDFHAAPAADKLEALVALIKAHPGHPKIEEWMKTTHDLIQSYQAQQPTSPASNPNAPPAQAPIAPDGPDQPAVSMPASTTTPVTPATK